LSFAAEAGKGALSKSLGFCRSAWTDVRTHRIPNLLNLLCALSGLGYQMGAWGLSGLEDGLLGLLLGFGLMIGFYLFVGIGAGDVKALAALGTWLGPWNTFLLFILMGLSGLPLVILFFGTGASSSTKYVNSGPYF
jgi:prepilin peptidase CpaA